MLPSHCTVQLFALSHATNDPLLPPSPPPIHAQEEMDIGEREREMTGRASTEREGGTSLREVLEGGREEGGLLPKNLKATSG